MAGQVVMELAYGENRDQSSAYLESTVNSDPLAWDKFAVIAGEPSYISMADGDRTLQVMCLLAQAFRDNFDAMVPHIAIVCKHGNPCGAAVDWHNPIKAVRKAMLGDPLAVMGSEFKTNFSVTAEVGEAIYRVPPELEKMVGRKYWGPDVVFAPGFDEAAVELLGKRERRRLLANPALQWPTMPEDEWMIRPVRGGFLRQRVPKFVFHWFCSTDIEGWVGEAFQGDQLATLLLAWAVAWRANSNTVILAKDQMLIGPSVGQQDRVACVQLALDRAKRSGHDTRGAVFASDAFFPYARRTRDDAPLEGPELLAEAGCIGGVVPADGKNLEEVKEYFREHNMRVAFVAKEHRGFSQH